MQMETSLLIFALGEPFVHYDALRLLAVNGQFTTLTEMKTAS
jgi:hypothetical protein